MKKRTEKRSESGSEENGKAGFTLGLNPSTNSCHLLLQYHNKVPRFRLQDLVHVIVTSGNMFAFFL